MLVVVGTTGQPEAAAAVDRLLMKGIRMPETDRPRPTALLPPRSYGKPEAAAAVNGLLMMGIRMPETC